MGTSRVDSTVEGLTATRGGVDYPPSARIMPDMEICAECHRQIEDQYVLRVGDSSLHQECLKCASCRTPLTESCFSKFGQFYCRRDFTACSDPVAPPASSCLPRRTRRGRSATSCSTLTASPAGTARPTSPRETRWAATTEATSSAKLTTSSTATAWGWTAPRRPWTTQAPTLTW